MLVHTINLHHITQETMLISFVHRTERDSSFSFKLMYLYYYTIIHTFIVNARKREMGKILGFVLIDFEEGYFSILTLFHLSKKHVLITCNKILLNITATITLGCKM